MAPGGQQLRPRRRRDRPDRRPGAGQPLVTDAKAKGGDLFGSPPFCCHKHRPASPFARSASKGEVAVAALALRRPEGFIKKVRAPFFLSTWIFPASRAGR